MPDALILSTGRDSLLLETRGQILQHAGYTVVSVLLSEQVLDEVRVADFDVVILCHSIPIGEREHLAKAIRNRAPKTRVVVIAAAYPQSDSLSDAVIGNEPTVMLREISKLVRNSF